MSRWVEFHKGGRVQAVEEHPTDAHCPPIRFTGPIRFTPTSPVFIQPYLHLPFLFLQDARHSRLTCPRR